METIILFILSSVGILGVCSFLFFFLFGIWFEITSAFGRNWTLKKHTQKELDYFKKLEYKGTL